MSFFETEVPGKFIVAGEHAVLRGSPALVFPLHEKRLKLRYEKTDEGLSLKIEKDAAQDLNLVFWGVLERALELSGHSRNEIAGRFFAVNSIPVGAGLGASAALCSAVARWVLWKGWIRDGDIHEFARQLENLFHGESSGVDVAAILSGEGLMFRRGRKPETFTPRWKPNWYLSYSGQRGLTAECIQKVKTLWARSEKLGKEIDRDMEAATALAMEGLSMENNIAGVELLGEGLDRARRCFERWGLVAGAVESHMTHLLSEGALAVKPTGSGAGGFVISLWSDNPPASLPVIRI